MVPDYKEVVMKKQITFATLAVFITWSVMDYLIHGVLLSSIYQETASMWRPMAEMKPVLMWVVTLIAALCMVSIYALFFKQKNLKNGVLYGLLLGIGWGMSMGFGSYVYMPIPYMLAQAWFWATLVEAVAAGVVMALIIKD
jgi:hypothetical protein